MGLAHGGDIVSDGLVLCLDAGNVRSYPGNGSTWTDLSKNGNNGTLINGPTFSSDNGGSIVFDGSNDYVNCGASISNTFTSFTIEAIVKIGKVNSKQAIFTTYSQIGFGLELLNNNVFSCFGFQNTSTVDGLAASSTVSLNNTYHISSTYSSSNFFKNYINGSESSSKSTTITSISKLISANLTIGNNTPAQNIPFGGSIYMVKFYNKALSSDEIKQNYLATKGRFNL